MLRGVVAFGHRAVVTCKLALAVYLYKGSNYEPLLLLTFNTPWKDLNVEICNEAFCALGKTGRIGLQLVRYFQETMLWAPFLHRLVPIKELKSSMVTSASCHWQTCSAKYMGLITCIPLSPKSHIYWPASYHFRAVSQKYLKCFLPDYCPHFAPNKTTHSAHVLLFFFQSTASTFQNHSADHAPSPLENVQWLVFISIYKIRSSMFIAAHWTLHNLTQPHHYTLCLSAPVCLLFCTPVFSSTIQPPFFGMGNLDFTTF